MLFSRKFCSAYWDISVWCTYKPLLISHGYVCSFYGHGLLNSLAFVWSVVYDELFRWNRCHMEALMFYVISHMHSCYKHFTGALAHEWFIASALWWPVERAGLAGCPFRHTFSPRPLSQQHRSAAFSAQHVEQGDDVKLRPAAHWGTRWCFSFCCWKEGGVVTVALLVVTVIIKQISWKLDILY